MSKATIAEFADSMNNVMPEIMREFSRRQVNELYKGKITLPQFFVLEFLFRKGELKMTDLAGFMNVTTAAMTGIVERLVASGYVLRAYEPQDRRIIKIRLTDKGNCLVKKTQEQRRQMFMDIFGRISEEDRRDYLRILMQIRDVLSSRKEA